MRAGKPVTPKAPPRRSARIAAPAAPPAPAAPEAPKAPAKRAHPGDVVERPATRPRTQAPAEHPPSAKAAAIAAPDTRGVRKVGISFDAATQSFTLAMKRSSYVFRVVNGDLRHEHWGAPIRDLQLEPPAEYRIGWQGPEDQVPRELPDFGRGDFRPPAIRVQTAHGTAITALVYESHAITPGKPAIPGLAASRAEDGAGVETLSVRLRDPLTGLATTLFYTVFPELDVLARHTEVTNEGTEPLQLQKLASFSVDLPKKSYRLLQLSGSWAHERHELVSDLKPGDNGIESRLGAAGHEHEPFVALLDPGADETHGEVRGFSLQYPGSFKADVEKSAQGNVRVALGLNPFDTSWKLEPGASFSTPECLGVFSANGTGEMSRRLHDFIRQHVVRAPWSATPPPVLLNNWEATYFKFDHDKIVDIATDAAGVGVKLLVLDDGWFGNKHPRDHDRAGLGDLEVNRAKLPLGLDGLARAVNDRGMRFGLWVEPEMIQASSELYERHPEWCLHVPGRARTEVRNQLVLDMCNPEVQSHLIERLTAVLQSAPIDYVKWDFNRALTEAGSTTLPADQQSEVSHRFNLGLYRVLDAVSARFPKVRIEACASGGGRPAGLLSHCPQFWTSDNTAAARRLRIQWGTSVVYPASVMGGHVAAIPNHQEYTSASLCFRAHVAMMCGSFGYELDPTKLTDAEKQQTREHIALYEDIQPVVHGGDLYRLRSPFTDNWPAAMFLSKDGARAVLFAFQQHAEARIAPPRLQLTGLDPDARYEIPELGRTYGGDQLMSRGLDISFRFCGDGASHVLRLNRVG